MFEVYDIGVNLTDKQFNKDREEIIEEAYKNKIGLIITGCSQHSNEYAIDVIQKSKYPMYCTLGIHPHNANSYDDNFKKSWYDLYNKNKDKVVAVGEIGLDYDRMFSPKDIQINTFEKMIQIAKDTQLPMFLHERKAVDDFYSILKNNPNEAKKSVVHCFTGNVNAVKKYLSLDCMIGITGWICDDKRNSELLESIKEIPLEKLMIETDAPWLTPKNVKLPRRNVPTNINYVYEKIAELKNIDVDIVKKQTCLNTKNFFNI